MFTGIVTAIGSVRAAQKRGGDLRLTIDTPAGFLKKVREGDSIACNGICLTAIAPKRHSFAADLSVETLDGTTARRWSAGRRLNLEKALTPATPLGGHLVTGHVDGVGTLRSRRAEARSWRFEFQVPAPLRRYIARKGSICIDGTSLTVNAVGRTGFGVNIIPHTLAHTTLGDLKPGDPVNLEVDLLARYLERLIRS